MLCGKCVTKSGDTVDMLDLAHAVNQGYVMVMPVIKRESLIVPHQQSCFYDNRGRKGEDITTKKVFFW